jgi:CysZ protein
MNPADFARGVSYAFKGFAILRKYPALARYWSIPILLTLVALVASVLLSVRYHDDVLGLLWSEPRGAGGWSWLVDAVYAMARAMSFVVSLALFTLLGVVLSMWLAAPFNDALSEAVELRELGRPAPPFSLSRLGSDLVRTLSLETFKLAAFLLVMGPLWLLSWMVPGAGQLAYTVVGATVTCAYFAIDYTDWPASRRGLGVRARLALMRRRPFLMLGFGLAVWGCLFVPVLNVAFMPIAVAGGTRLFLDLESHEQL